MPVIIFTNMNLKGPSSGLEPRHDITFGSGWVSWACSACIQAMPLHWALKPIPWPSEFLPLLPDRLWNLVFVFGFFNTFFRQLSHRSRSAREQYYLASDLYLTIPKVHTRMMRARVLDSIQLWFLCPLFNGRFVVLYLFNFVPFSIDFNNLKKFVNWNIILVFLQNVG